MKFQSAANLATVIVAFLTAGSLGYGCFQFNRTQHDALQVLELERQTLDQDRESKAVDLFVKYNEMMNEPRQAGNGFWRENLGLSISESILRLRNHDTGWKETVAWMLSNHVDHLRRNGLNCPTYDPEFVKLANSVTQDDLCRPR